MSTANVPDLVSPIELDEAHERYAKIATAIYVYRVGAGGGGRLPGPRLTPALS